MIGLCVFCGTETDRIEPVGAIHFAEDGRLSGYRDMDVFACARCTEWMSVPFDDK